MTDRLVAATPTPSPDHYVRAYVDAYEKYYGIPSGLLLSVAKMESGTRNKQGVFVAWPWTVHARGRGYHFLTKEAAISAVNSLHSRGVKSIDVGCMQVNLKYHPRAFRNLQEAFNPAHNIAYAAAFLNHLHRRHASWEQAVARYHSAIPAFNIPYCRHVLALWRQKETPGSSQIIPASFRIPKPPVHEDRLTQLRRKAYAIFTKRQNLKKDAAVKALN